MPDAKENSDLPPIPANHSSRQEQSMATPAAVRTGLAVATENATSSSLMTASPATSEPQSGAKSPRRFVLDQNALNSHLGRRRSSASLHKSPSASSDLLHTDTDAHFRPMAQAQSTDLSSSASLTELAEEMPSGQCACSRLTVMDGMRCGQCQSVIPVLAERNQEVRHLRDELETLRLRLQEEESRSLRLIKENQKFMIQVSQLEGTVDLQADEINTLRSDTQTLSSKLVREVEKRAEIQVERDRISEELEELTRSLFEEANGMVADEARRRFELEQAQKKLQSELDVAKTKLDSERRAVMALRRRLSQVSVASMRANISHDSLPVQKSAGDSVAARTAQLQIGSTPTASQSHLDSFASLEIDDLPDQRMYDDFLILLHKVAVTPMSKLASQVPFFKMCQDEHVDPCIRLPKLAGRKIMDAIVANQLQLLHVERRELSLQKSNASTSTGGNTAKSALLEAPDQSAARRANSSPSKQQFWSSFSSSSSASSDPNVCAGCGREGPCTYNMSLSATSTADRSDSTGLSLGGYWLDNTCRDRVFAVWAFYAFVRGLREFSTAVDNKPRPQDLFVECLRKLKHMFYARIGVLGFFRSLEQELHHLEQQQHSATTTVQESPADAQSSEPHTPVPSVTVTALDPEQVVESSSSMA